MVWKVLKRGSHFQPICLETLFSFLSHPFVYERPLWGKPLHTEDCHNAGTEQVKIPGYSLEILRTLVLRDDYKPPSLPSHSGYGRRPDRHGCPHISSRQSPFHNVAFFSPLLLFFRDLDNDFGGHHVSNRWIKIDGEKIIIGKAHIISSFYSSTGELNHIDNSKPSGPVGWQSWNGYGWPAFHGVAERIEGLLDQGKPRVLPIWEWEEYRDDLKSRKKFPPFDLASTICFT